MSRLLFNKLGGDYLENSILLTYDLSEYIGDYSLILFKTHLDNDDSDMFDNITIYYRYSKTGAWSTTSHSHYLYNDVEDLTYIDIDPKNSSEFQVKIIFNGTDKININNENHFGLYDYNVILNDADPSDIKITEVDFSNFKCNVTYTQNIFQGTRYTQKIILSSGFDLSNCTSLMFLFNQSGKLNTNGVEIEGYHLLNTTNVTKFYQVFPNNMTETNIKNMLESWNLFNVTDLSRGFYNTQVSNIYNILQNCFTPQNISNVSYCFYNCKNINSAYLGSLQLSNVTTMSYMFDGCTNLKDIKLPNSLPKLENMAGMFRNCISLEKVDFNNIQLPEVTSMSNMFFGCTSLVEFKTNLDIPNLTNVNNMFRNVNTVGWYYYSSKCPSHELIYKVKPEKWNLMNIDSNNFVEIWTTHTAIDYYDTTVLYLLILPDKNDDQLIKGNIITGFDVLNYNKSTEEEQWKWVDQTESLFDKIKTFTYNDQYIIGFEKSTLEPLAQRTSDLQFKIRIYFGEDKKLNYVSKIVNKEEITSNMFEVSSTLYTLHTYLVDMSNLKMHNLLLNTDNSNALGLKRLFRFNESIDTIIFSDISQFDSFQQMCWYCKKLTTISFDKTVINWNVTNTSRMFSDCENLGYGSTKYDTGIKGLFSDYHLCNVTDMSYMFYNCKELRYLDNETNQIGITYINQREYDKVNQKYTYTYNYNVTNMGGIFRGCSNLEWDSVDSAVRCQFSVISFLNCGFPLLESLMYGFAESNIGNDGIYRLNNNIFTKANCSKLTDISYCFQSCENLVNIKEILNNDNEYGGNNIKNCEGLFQSCSNLEECILNDCGSVENFKYTFRYCNSLVKLTIKELNNEVVVDSMFYNIKTDGWYYGTGPNDPVCNVIPDTWNKVYDDDNNEAQYIKLTYNITDKETLKLFCVEKDNFDGKTVIDGIVVNNYKVLDNNISFEFTGDPVEFQVDQNREYSVKLYINSTFIKTYDLIDYLSFYNCNFTEIDFSKLDMSTQKSTVNDNDICLLLDCINCTSVIFPNNLQQMVNFDEVYCDTNITQIDLSGVDMPNIETLNYTFSNEKIKKVILPKNLTKITQMKCTFAGSGISSIDMSSIKINSIKNMNNTFNGCKLLNSLSFNNGQFENIQSFYGTFQDCTTLQGIKLPFVAGEKTIQLSNFNSMFRGCTNIRTITFGDSTIDKSNYCIIEKPDIGEISANYMFYGCKNLEYVNFYIKFANNNTTTSTASWLEGVPNSNTSTIKLPEYSRVTRPGGPSIQFRQGLDTQIADGLNNKGWQINQF